MKNGVICLLVSGFLASCTYLQHAFNQAEYTRIQKADPGQLNLKHMINRETYFVIGQTEDKHEKFTQHSLAVAAYSDKFKHHERVDTMYFAGAGTHFGLNLPEGDYQLLVFADIDENQVFERSEVIGHTGISLNQQAFPYKILNQVKVPLEMPRDVDWVEPISRPETVEPQQSLFYPKGTIRHFDDPLFDDNVATLGMYDPASFLEKAPTMFYALEEDLGYKIPVVFVHGIGGSVREFQPIVEKLDRDRYKPWFFYYPSGEDLNQLAHFFHQLFFSGNVVRLGEMPMIVIAHSMGGLIVREALNEYDPLIDKNRISLWVSIASPFAGHPAAAVGEKHGLMVLPSWRDLNPESRFIDALFRFPLPESLDYQLLYAYHNPSTIKISRNSDGVVPLASQLRLEAQQQASGQLGFASSHTGILKNEEMIKHLLEQMDQVENIYPDSHLEILHRGGYEVSLTDEYSQMGQYFIRTNGRYWMALSTGILQPAFPEQERFVRVVRGEVSPQKRIVQDWLRFLKQYPGSEQW